MPSTRPRPRPSTPYFVGRGRIFAAPEAVLTTTAEEVCRERRVRSWSTLPRSTVVCLADWEPPWSVNSAIRRCSPLIAAVIELVSSCWW